MDEREAYILAGAASYLVEGQELYEASILLLCPRLSLTEGHGYYSGTELITNISVELFGNRTVCEIINDEQLSSRAIIRKAIEDALGIGYSITSFTCRAVISDSLFASDWRSKLLDVIEGKIPLNQGVPIQDKPRYTIMDP